MKKKDENQTYLICSLFCNRSPVNVKYKQSVLLSTGNNIQTTKACNICEV